MARPTARSCVVYGLAVVGVVSLVRDTQMLRGYVVDQELGGADDARAAAPAAAHSAARLTPSAAGAGPRPPLPRPLPVPRVAACKIFTLWDYPWGVPLYAHYNAESWRRHTGGLCEVILVNSTNVMQFIPDMPEEWPRLYLAAKSDAVRYALLYHHGGFYLDSDFLVVGDLAPLVRDLHKYDFISYENEGQRCTDGKFSSNFLGGRKGSKVHHAIWRMQKVMIKDHCKPGFRTEARTCCYDDPSKDCHVPWASLGERISHLVFKKLTAEGAVSHKCFDKHEGFALEGWAEVMRMQHPTVAAGLAYWRKRRVLNPLDRTMYHLFNQLTAFRFFTRERLFNTTNVIGHLYNRSFGGVVPPLPEALELASRIEKATRPTVAKTLCKDINNEGSSGEGSWYVWCEAVMSRLSALKASAVGLSYGISTWDNWSKHLASKYSFKTVLYDCYCTPATCGETPSLEGYKVPNVRVPVCVTGDFFLTRSNASARGERFEALSQHLAPGSAPGTLVKMDVEGSEWGTLRSLADDDMRKIDVLHLKAYFCKKPQESVADEVIGLEERIAILERLARFFSVVGRAPSEMKRTVGARDDDICEAPGTTQFMSVSYVSKRRLKEAMSS